MLHTYVQLSGVILSAHSRHIESIKDKGRPKRSLAWTWLITYVLILLLPIFTSFFVFSSYQRIVRTEIDRSNKSVLNLTKQTIDQNFQDLRSIGYQLTLNPRHMRFANTYGSVQRSERMNLYELASDMTSYAAAQGYGNNLFTYYENTDSIVGPGAFYSNPSFYENVLAHRGITEERWLETISNDLVHQLVALGETQGGEQELLFIHSLKHYEMSSSQKLIAVLNSDQLSWPGGQAPDTKSSTSLIIRGAANRVLTVLGDLTLSANSIQKIESLDQSSELILDGEEYMFSLVESDVIGASYVALIPSNIYWESAQRLIAIILIASATALILGIALIILIVRRQYTPVENLITYLSTQNLNLEDRPANELDYIQASVETILQSKNTMEDRLESQNQQLRQTVMNRLLHGTINPTSLAQQDFPSLDLVFLHDHFTVVVFYMDKYGDDLSLAHFILRNIFEELVSQDYPTYTTKIDNLMVSVINHPISSAETFESFLSPHLFQTISILEEHFSFVLRSAISSPVSGMHEWSNAYHQVTASLTASLAASDPPAQNYIADDDSNTPLTDTSHQQKLYNFLRAQDYTQAEELLDDLLSPSSGARLNQEQWRYLHFALLVTIANSFGPDVHDDLLKREPFLELDQLLHNQQDCRPFFRDLLTLLPEERDPQDNRADSLAETLDNYIEANYRDNALNLNEFGDIFEMTPTYLARLYKEARGTGLLDTLNQRRVEEAKLILLDEPETTVADVAERSGFTNVNTFIRVFKKFEGITPGRFRSL